MCVYLLPLVQYKDMHALMQKSLHIASRLYKSEPTHPFYIKKIFVRGEGVRARVSIFNSHAFSTWSKVSAYLSNNVDVWLHEQARTEVSALCVDNVVSRPFSIHKSCDKLLLIVRIVVGRFILTSILNSGPDRIGGQM